MGRFAKGCLLVGAMLLVFSSCASMKVPFVPAPAGELRLKSARLPEVMQANVSYELELAFESEETAKIDRVCFRWVTQELSVGSPTLYGYAQEVQGNDQIGSFNSRWIGEGRYTNVSPAYCVRPAEVSHGSQGRITVTLPAEAVKADFNRIEAYVEYSFQGQQKESNRVAARTMIQQ